MQVLYEFYCHEKTMGNNYPIQFSQNKEELEEMANFLNEAEPYEIFHTYLVREIRPYTRDRDWHNQRIDFKYNHSH